MRRICVMAVSCALFMLLCVALPAGAQAQKKTVRAVLEIRPLTFDFAVAGAPVISVSDVPETIRTVPRHRDDAWLARFDTFTVPEGTLTANMIASFGVAVAPEFSVGPVSVRGGPIFSLPLTPSPQMETAGPTREINQYGSTARGRGSALVFYSLDTSWTALPGWLLEVEVSVGENVGLVVGRSVRPYKLEIQTGWDRFNALETFRTYDVSSNDLRATYAGIRYSDSVEDNAEIGVLFLAGTVGHRVRPTALGRRLNVGYREGVYLQVGVTIRWDWWQR